MKLLLHPLPVRIFHWIMFLAVMYLVITGLYMNDPWGNLSYGLVRKTHSIAGIILVLNTYFAHLRQRLDFERYLRKQNK